MADMLADGITSNGDPYRALAAAVLIQAVLDARRGKRSAAEWLLETGPFFMDALGFKMDFQYLETFVNNGCPAGARKRRHTRADKKLQTTCI